jgi:hypothetical protein
MKALLISILLLISSKSFGIYLLMGDAPIDAKRRAYHEVLAKEDYPVCLIQKHLPNERSIQQKLEKIHPRLKAYWAPTSQFQFFVLKSFFFDRELQEFAKKLGYSCGFYDKTDPEELKRFQKYKEEQGVSWDLNIDEKIVEALSTKNRQTLTSHYEKLNHREDFCTFFLKMNDAFLKDVRSSEIPRQKEVWQKNHFPFLYSFNVGNNIDLFLQLFQDHPEIIKKAVAEEIKAHNEGKFLIYRGAEAVQVDGERLLFFPLKAKKNDGSLVIDEEMDSFSLCYGSSLFGGCFLSLDACAARYAIPESAFHTFHALRLDQKSLLEDPLFCIPPLHPFVELFVDGEWFHPHSIMGKHKEGTLRYGWYAPSNRYFEDPLGFLTREDLPPALLARKLLELGAREAVILHTHPEDLHLPLENHKKVAKKL